MLSFSIVSIGVQRLIVVSGMGLTLSGDRKSVLDKVVAQVVRLLSPKVYADKVKELAVLQSSGIRWTAARVGALLEGEAKPLKVSLITPPGNRITTASLAAFCLDEVEQCHYVGAAPFVPN